jgi:hypothetical protein
MWRSALYDEDFEDFVYGDNLLDFAFWLKRVKLAEQPSTVNPFLAEKRIANADALSELCIDHAREFTADFTGPKAGLIKARFDAIDDKEDFSETQADGRLEWLDSSDPEAIYLNAMSVVNNVTLLLHSRPLEHFAEISNVVEIKRKLQLADFEATLSPAELTTEFTVMAAKLDSLSKLASNSFIRIQRENWFFLMREVKRLIQSLHLILAEKEDAAYVALGDSSRFQHGYKGFSKGYQKSYSRLVWLHLQRCSDLKEILELHLQRELASIN